MESLYRIAKISRQGFHQKQKKEHIRHQENTHLIERVEELRLTHPRMGARPLYQIMQAHQTDQTLLLNTGRDKFEQILLDNNLAVKPIKVYHRTTYSGAFRYPNLVEGLEICQLNRIWVSDLTYYRLLNGWAYLTFILDLYSRRCIGYAISKVMQTELTTIPALNMALQARAILDFKNQLIFHSDGGGQYYDKEFINIIQQHQIRSSMALHSYENPHMERFHSTAKNSYLIPWGVNSFSELEKRLPEFVYLYNHVKPHQGLNGLCPVKFERIIQNIPLCQRTSVLFKKVI